jgi:hypothetical protein
MLQKLDFIGEYKIFFPEIDLDENSKEIIKRSLVKLFGNCKVYFTDEKDVECFKEIKDNTIPTESESPIVQEQKICTEDDKKNALARGNAIREQRGLPPIVPPTKKVKYTDEYQKSQGIDTVADFGMEKKFKIPGLS